MRCPYARTNCDCGGPGDCEHAPDEGETPEDWNADENRWLDKQEARAQKRLEDLA